MAKTLKNPTPVPNHRQLQKCPTGIKGYDEITEGGLPKNRITLISGGAGAGKTFLELISGEWDDQLQAARSVHVF